jgi:hypothetical protein
MGPGDWNVGTQNGHELRVTGELEFTPRGTALVWCNCGKSQPFARLGAGPLRLYRAR